MPVAAALELFKIGKGAADSAQAKSEAEQLKNSRPVYNISPESTNELNLAESELQQGIGARAERAYTNQLDKTTANSLSALLRGGGNLNSVGDIFANAQDGMSRLAMLNENTRLNQINNLITANRNMTDQRDKQFMYNQDQWWKNDAQANAAFRQNSANELMNGVNGAASLATQYLQNKKDDKKMDDYLTGDQTPVTAMNNTDFYQFNGTTG